MKRAVLLKEPTTMTEARAYVEVYLSIEDTVRPRGIRAVTFADDDKSVSTCDQQNLDHKDKFDLEKQFNLLSEKLMQQVGDMVRDQLKSSQAGNTSQYRPNSQYDRVRRNQGYRRDISKLRCHECKQLGHFAASCPNVSDVEEISSSPTSAQGNSNGVRQSNQSGN
jgi:hypothetical protein